MGSHRTGRNSLLTNVPEGHNLRRMSNPLQAYMTLTDTTGTAMAERLGISPSFLSRLLSGDREADATLLANIERVSDGAVTPDQWVRWWRKARRRPTSSKSEATDAA